MEYIYFFHVPEATRSLNILGRKKIQFEQGLYVNEPTRQVEQEPVKDIYTYRGRSVTGQYSNCKPDLWLPDYQTIPSPIKH
ncbi:nuclear body associated kinase [Culex quinquefasciatus]|uniref:Nuclear body associated kinase n=1 Tax=Culex quinquefasciatus TaxID=7176 RepID=B0XIQ6_CULQU|nr:nuclear body associated kinase [Culex quinquefasciatus]|eukprot:XP_001869528.1 nuclear body associated kinase [Culex quinquefasciatus]